MSKMSGGRALLEALKAEGVDVAFGMPGGAIMPIYDDLYDFPIRHILVRHEQSAAHMADGYARISGRPGVCMATSGPGATNLVTGIATALMDSSPMVAITGQVPQPMIGKDAFQETDVLGVVTSITKYTFQPRRAIDVPRTVKAAFYLASTGRPGPVLIDVPKDVQIEQAEMDFPDSVEIRGYKLPPNPDPALIGKAIEILANAKQPMILAGHGITISGAFTELQTLAELLMAPVATSFMGKGCFPENHPLAVGCMGMHGNKVTNDMTYDADVLLVVGSRLSDRTTGRIDKFVPGSKFIHVDIDPAEIGKMKIPTLSIVGDARRILAMILSGLQGKLQRVRTPWHNRLLEAQQIRDDYPDEFQGHVSAVSIIKALRRSLPPDAIVTTEVGQCQTWAEVHFKVYKPGTFFHSGGLGTMGFGFPASLGAKIAKPDVPVVDIAGDGSFLMTENSLATSIEEKIPVIVVLINNRVLGMVAQWARLFYNRRYSGVLMGTSPDFVKLAEAYGAQGIRAESVQEFSTAMKKALASDVTTVIDVPISPEENVLPMLPPGATLKDTIVG